MKALVKKEAEPGLWLEEVPVPKTGINDVLIKVLRTGICGTDVHIYEWDAWARKTIPVPMVIGHEFVGEIVEVGSNVKDFHPGEIVSGEGHVVCGRCRNCLAGRRHLCKDTKGVGVNRPGALRRVPRPADDQRLGPRPERSAATCGHLRPVRQRGPHGPVSFDVLGEDVLITGAGPIGIMAAAVVAARRGPPRRRHRRQSLSPRAGAADGCDARRRRRASSRSPKRQKQLGMKEGFDVGLEMSGNPAAFRDMLANMCHGGKIAMLGIPTQRDRRSTGTRSSSTCSRSRASTAARCTRPGTR